MFRPRQRLSQNLEHTSYRLKCADKFLSRNPSIYQLSIQSVEKY